MDFEPAPTPVSLPEGRSMWGTSAGHRPFWGRPMVDNKAGIDQRQKCQDPPRENRVLSDRPTQKPTILVYKTAQRSRESPGIDQRLEFSLEIVQVSTSCLIWVLGALKERQVVLIKILH